MINVAVIGCGRWGPNHIRNLNSLPGSRVAVAIDTDRARLSRVSELFPEIRVDTDVSVAFTDAIDAVVVATPTSTHHGVVRQALLAGKHVLCEKPLCETSVLAQELTELALSRRLVLMVGHVFLFNDGIGKLKELVDAGDLGKLQHLSAMRTNLGPIRQDVNAALDLATHDIAIFNWILGAVPDLASAVGASFLQPGVEDVVCISLRYPGGIFANIQASWLSPKKVRQITAVGTKRMVTWDDLDLSTPIAIYESGAETKQEYSDYGEFLRVTTWDGDVRLPKVNFQEPLKAQARAFVEAVGTGAVSRSDGPFSLGVVRVLDAITRSLAENGALVKVPS
jgi:predicted dehydrogenase